MAQVETSIFWIETDKIVPNPYQPRREFDEDRLKELSDSIRQYGVLQPLVVSRVEESLPDGSVKVRYELIAGERRLRASKLAGVTQVPVVVRTGDDSRAKLELAIIENLQREDLNAVERAQSFQRLADEFKLSWADVGRKVGKSREYVSNTVRILMLPQDILDALSKGKITEGHTRPLLMLIDRPQEQMTLFKEMMVRKMTVREAEQIARRIAFEKVRKKDLFMTPEVVDMEEKLAETLGTRVQIEPRERGGRIWIDYFSHEELLALSIAIRKAGEAKTHKGMFDTLKDEDMETLREVAASPRHIDPVTDDELTHLKKQTTDNRQQTTDEMQNAGQTATQEEVRELVDNAATQVSSEAIEEDIYETTDNRRQTTEELQEEIMRESEVAVDDRSTEDVKAEEQNEDLYNVKNFAL